MSDSKPANNNEQNQLQEEYLRSYGDIEEGQIIKGTVFQVGDEFVFIDVGLKSEGKVPVSEFSEAPEIGAEVYVSLEKKEGRQGQVVVSKKKADHKLVMRSLKEAFSEGNPVEGVFAKEIKGGYEVDLGGEFTGFNPFSKTDLHKVEDSQSYIGLKSRFMIDRLYHNNKIKIVLSRRAWLEVQRDREQEKFFSERQIGDTVSGVVKSFTSFGAFIDLGGFDGLLHINDMSWGHVTRPKDYVKKGDTIETKIINLDPEQKKINLSLKHFTQDPWETFAQRYSSGDVVSGRVTKLATFGAFIEIEEGVEGMVHVSELSWVKRINHPKEVLNIGDSVEAKILSIDIASGRISLGVKQITDNPWDTVEERYSEGDIIKSSVCKVTGAGVFITLEDGIDGFLHNDDMSWIRHRRGDTPRLKEGNDIETVILSVDSKQHRIRLGAKQLTEDPWKTLKKSYPRGSLIEGEVTDITDFGVFVRVLGGVEGLIGKNNLVDKNSEKSDEEALKEYKSGDKVKAAVLDVDDKKRKLSLSIREYERGLHREEISQYIHDEDDGTTFTLGDALNAGNDSGE